MNTCKVAGLRHINAVERSYEAVSRVALDLVGLVKLMELSGGSPEVGIGLIDGPVAGDHADFAESPIQEIPIKNDASCRSSKSAVCQHGTFIAGMFSAKRGADAPAICPGCTLLVRPIFSEGAFGDVRQPSANPDELAAAVFDCITAGARVINLSLSVAQHSTGTEKPLTSALNHAMLRGVIIIAAAGNQNTIGSNVITSHPWVIPITACDREGFPSTYSNAGLSIGGRGLRAPGEGIRSSGAHGLSISSSGTSVAAPFATGTIALLWSMFPDATAQEIKHALTQAPVRRTSIVPPLLNAWTAYQTLGMRHR